MIRLALVLPLCLVLGARPRAGLRLENALPEGTLLFAETPDAATFRAAFRKTSLFRFFEDEEVKTFLTGALETVMKDFQGFTKDFEKELGIPWEQAWELPSGQVAFAMPTIAEDPAALQADLVLALDCGGKRDRLLKGLTLARRSYEKRGKKAETFRVGDDEVVSGELLAKNSRWYASVVDDTLLLATRKPTVEQVIAGLRGGQPKPLARSAAFLKAREKAQARELFLYADVAGFVKTAEERLPDDVKRMIRSLGLQGFTTAAGGVAMGDGQVRERFFLGTTGERKGLARFLSLKGPAAGFEAAPEDALQFLSFSVDVAELYDTVLETVKGADEFGHQQLLEQIAAFEKEAEISLKNDLFPAFGPKVYAYAALPPDGILPDGVTCFEIKDAARFDKCLRAALKGLQAKLGEIDFQGKKIQYLLFDVPAELFDPVRMLLSTLYLYRDGDKLFVSGVSPFAAGFGAANALKRHIQRQGKPTLAGAASVRQWTGGKTDGASFVLYLNLEKAFNLLYNSAAPLAVFFRDTFKELGSGVDLIKIPRGEAVGKYLGQTIHRVSVAEDGLQVDGISTSGTTLMTGVYAGAAAVVLLPAMQRASEAGRTSACMAQCSSVFFAVVTCRQEKKKFPEKTGAEFLAQLKEFGYLDEIPVCPHSGEPSYRGPAKDANAMEEGDVLFCDEPGNHPDGSINVLRKSGAMERLEKGTPAYEKALETTRGK